MGKTYPYYPANTPRRPSSDLAVFDNYSGKTAARVAMADERAIEEMTEIRLMVLRGDVDG